jgi:hypothetical protein
MDSVIFNNGKSIFKSPENRKYLGFHYSLNHEIKKGIPAELPECLFNYKMFFNSLLS